MENRITDQIIKVYHTLSVGERKIADYVLGHLEQFPHMSTLEVKSATGVAEPTIFRFCKRIGYPGIKDFKLAIAQSQQPPESTPKDANAQTSGLPGLVNLSLEAERRIIETTLEMLDYDILQKTIEMIFRANRICLFGIGSSYLVCNDAQRKLLSVGINAGAYNEQTDALALVHTMKPDDLVFCVSHSGVSYASLQIIRAAKRLKINTALMTSFPMSICAKYADCILKTYAPEMPGSRTGISSRVSQFALFDAMYIMIVYGNDPGIQSNIEKTNRDIIQET